MAALKKNLFNLLILILSTGTMLSLFEIAVLRLFGEQPKFPRHVVGSTFGVRINEPNASYMHKSADIEVQFKINSQGMRADRDYAYTKPPGLYRIISLGDSFTMGYEVDREDCFSSILEKELKSNGYKVEVLNAGVSGFSTAEEYLYLKRALLKYQPDLVLVSFYTNDLADNVRTRLFKLKGDKIVSVSESYLPMGGLGNFLNTNRVFSWLSEKSNAFVFLKEQLTFMRKKNIILDNIKNLNVAEDPNQNMDEIQLYANRLTASIFEEIYKVTRNLNIPLIIHSIPSYRENPDRLVDLFPIKEFDLTRQGIFFLSSKNLLDTYIGKRQLYWMRSHRHWTPFSHKVAGQALANVTLRTGIFNKYDAMPSSAIFGLTDENDIGMAINN